MKMRTNAVNIGLYALNVLKKGYQSSEIINVFDSTVNVRVGDDLIVITSTSLVAPINLNVNLDYSFKKFVDPGDMVYMRHGYIEVGDLNIYLNENTSIYEGNIRLLHGSFYEAVNSIYLYTNRLAVISRILGELKENSIYINNFVKKEVLNIINSLVDRASVSCKINSEVMLNLLGLGHGFTPSGDDLVLGIVAAWNTMRLLGLEPVSIDESVATGRTHWVSGKLVLYSSRLLLAEPIDLSLYRLLVHSDADHSLDIIMDMARYGHSSGTEIMGGLAIGLALSLECLGYRGIAPKVAYMLFS